MVDINRQEKPHAHQAIFSPSGNSVVVCDLGGDCVILYNFSAKTGVLRQRQRLLLAPGTGPRHAAFHPTQPFLFVLGELTSTIALCRLQKRNPPMTKSTVHDSSFDDCEEDAWSMELAGSPVSTLPSDFPPNSSWCSAICVSHSGRLVFGANRGHDSVAIFRVVELDGAIINILLVSFITSFGSIPRDIALHPSEKILYVAAQNDNLLTAFLFDEERGVAQRLGSPVCTPTPVCIVPFQVA